MSNFERQYLAHLDQLLASPATRPNRTDVATSSIFGHQMRVDLTKGFPMLTTKSVHWRSVAHELLWFLSGSTNVKYLNDNGVRIWDEWAGEDGELGPVYGRQWRRWENDNGDLHDSLCEVNYTDQIADLIHNLKTNPTSRRHIVSAWNVGDLKDMALPPCHTLFQFNVRPISLAEIIDYIHTNLSEAEQTAILPCLDETKPPQANLYVLQNHMERIGLKMPTGFLDCQLYQRSADWFLGVPFNVASYSLLTHMIAQEVGLAPGHFIHSFGDTHLYENHVQQAREQLSRSVGKLPRLFLRSGIGLFDMTFDDMALAGYFPAPAIKAKVAV